MCPTCALSYAARVGFRSNDSDPRHAQGESARVRPLLRPAATSEGRVLSSAHCPHCQTRRFSRGVILIGALRKVLRLPLLQESGRLRHNLLAHIATGSRAVGHEHTATPTAVVRLTYRLPPRTRRRHPSIHPHNAGPWIPSFNYASPLQLLPLGQSGQTCSHSSVGTPNTRDDTRATRP